VPKLVRNTAIAGMMLMLLFMGMSSYIIVRGVGRIVGQGLKLVL